MILPYRSRLLLRALAMAAIGSACLANLRAVAGVPLRLNYQGFYKEGDPAVPYTGSKTMKFTLTDSLGNAVAASNNPYQEDVYVATGVFRVSIPLASNFPWGTVEPYVKLTVGGVDMAPLERVASTPYALYAGIAEGLTAPAGQAGLTVSTSIFISAGSFSVNRSPDNDALALLKADLDNGIVFVGNPALATNAGQKTLQVHGFLQMGGDLILNQNSRIVFPDNSILNTAALGGAASSVSNTGTAQISANTANGNPNSQVLFTLGSPAVSRMLITNYGNVGIGVTPIDTPRRLVHVAAGGADGTDGAELKLSSGPAEGSLLYGGGKLSLGTWADSDLTLFTNGLGNPRVTVQGGGNVGIGVTAPSSLLEVAGTVTATAFAGDGSELTNLPITGFLARSGDAMTGPLTLAGSTLTVSGGAFSVGGSTFAVSGGTVSFGGLLMRAGSGAYGSLAPSHVNLGIGSVTGAASGDPGYAAVGGGLGNVAAGAFSSVPGGQGNQANGDWSLAAGRQARADAPGSFVWADSQGVDLVGAVRDQFRVRAQGGFYVDASSVTFARSGTAQLFLSSAGSMGVGLLASTPGRALQAGASGVPQLRLTGGSSYADLYADSNGGLRLLPSSSIVMMEGASGRFEMWTGGVGSSRVNQLNVSGNSYITGGNLGVGTNSPGAKLTVQGGDVYVKGAGVGIVLQESDGANCRRLTVNAAGTLSVSQGFACP